MRETDNQACTPSRPKYWSELGLEEKVVRIREVVKQQDFRMRALEAELHKLASQFPDHSHTDGRVVIPAKDSHPWGYEARPSTRLHDEEYF